MTWEGPATVTVKARNGELAMVEINATDTVRTLQDAVRRQLGVVPKHQLLHTHIVHVEAELREQAYSRDRLLGEFDLRGRDLHLTDFTGLRTHRRDFCKIDKTEHRGMSLRQIDLVLDVVRGWTRHGQWYDMSDKSPTYQQVLQFDQVNLYHVCEWLIKPATYESRCSFVELLADRQASQEPVWYVSHWWGESISRFATGLKGHAKLRHLADDTTYWVCAYALNQHDPASDLECDVSETAFMKAIQDCVGVVLILDKNATPFKRVWCCFEEAMAVSADPENSDRILLDIATVVDGHAVIITDGLTEEEQQMELREISTCGSGWRKKADRERIFPMHLIHRGLEVSIQCADATRCEDKARILNFIAGVPAESLNDPLPLSHEAYDMVNTKLCAIFALAGWPTVMASSGVDAGKRADLVRSFADALKRDTGRTRVNLSFFNCMDFGDRHLWRIADSLPPGLQELTLNLGACRALSNDGPEKLFRSLPESLRRLSLDFFWCDGLDDTSLSTFASLVPPKLESLKLSYRKCGAVAAEGFAALAAALPARLATLELHFDNCNVSDTAFEGWTAPLPPGLQAMKLSWSSSTITDRGMRSLARALPNGIKDMHLSFASCDRLGNQAVISLVRDLPLQLRSCFLDFEGCGKISQGVLDRLDSGFREIRRWQLQLLEERELPPNASPDALPDLVTQLSCEDDRVRAGCALALCDAMAHAGMRAYKGCDRCRGAEALAACFASDGDPVRHAILQGVDKNNLWQSVMFSGEILEGQLLDNDDVERRTLAIRGLTWSSDAGWYIGSVAPFLSSEEPDLLHAAAEFMCANPGAAEQHMRKLLDILDVADRRAFDIIGRTLVKLPPSVFGPHLPSLAKLAGHNDQAVRDSADIALGRLSMNQQASAYIGALTHELGAVRRGAATALGLLGSAVVAQHTECIQDLLLDPDPLVWAAAAKTLQYIGAKVQLTATELSERAWDENQEVYEFACQELLTFPPDETIKFPRALVVAMALPNTALKQRAERRLQKLTPKRLADALVEALGHKNTTVRQAITEALPRLVPLDLVPRVAPMVLEKLGRMDEAMRDLLAQVFTQFGQPALTSLYDCIDDGRNTLELRVCAVEILGCICLGSCGKADEPASPVSSTTVASTRSALAVGDAGAAPATGGCTVSETVVPLRVLEVLNSCLAERAAPIRAAAAQVIGMLGLTKRAPKLGELLNDDAPEVRKAAVFALKGCDGTACTHANQFSVFLNEEDSDLRQAAAAALGEAGVAAVPHMPELARCLSDSDEKVRGATATALVRLGPASAEHAAGHLGSKYWRTRQKAVEVLGQLGDASIPYFVEIVTCLDDENTGVRKAAMEALESWQSNPSTLGNLLSDDADFSRVPASTTGSMVTPRIDSQARARSTLRCAILSMLSRSSEAATQLAPEIAHCLADASSTVRRAAFQALQHVDAGMPVAEAHLLQRSMSEDSPKDVRVEAIRASGRIALGSCAEEVRDALLLDLSNFLDDPDREVREAAAQGFRQHGAGALLPQVAAATAAQLRSEHWFARQNSAEVLRDLALDSQSSAVVAEHVDDLVDRLADTEQEVRVAALRAIGRLGAYCKPHLATMQQCLSDGVADVRVVAAEVLGLSQEKQAAARSGPIEIVTSDVSLSFTTAGRSRLAGTRGLRFDPVLTKGGMDSPTSGAGSRGLVRQGTISSPGLRTQRTQPVNSPMSASRVAARGRPFSPTRNNGTDSVQSWPRPGR